MPRSVFEQTPLEEVYKNDTFANSKHVATHLSDGLRAALVYKVCEKHFYSLYFNQVALVSPHAVWRVVRRHRLCLHQVNEGNAGRRHRNWNFCKGLDLNKSNNS